MIVTVIGTTSFQLVPLERIRNATPSFDWYRGLTKRPMVKNPDFLLYPQFGVNLVVEVKGKRAKNKRGRRDWENWVTTDDLDGLVVRIPAEQG